MTLQLPVHGKIADVPVIIGDVKDEGPIFSLGMMNNTTDKEFASYLAQTWFPGAPSRDLTKLLQLYLSDPSLTGIGNANAFTPQYKRISAVQGDWFFNPPRALLVDRSSRHQASRGRPDGCRPRFVRCSTQS
ncbi:hypothetical protein L226DRAFT_279440 [Lentinus tigrinus ALCF2SS1-7]|nr:hypothetical protein L226DRAFT_279440 [Lentinus tigrinus ALCF2SS1-7]